MIILNNHQDTPKKEVKLYKTNDLANLRLTKKRSDVMNVLNEKKSQGVDISEYFTYLIRKEEGLPIPVEEGATRVAPAPTGMGQEDREAIAEMVYQLMKKNGMVGLTGEAPTESEEKQVDQGADAKMLEEAKNAAKEFLDWDD